MVAKVNCLKTVAAIAPTHTPEILSAQGLEVHFSGVRALDNVDLRLEQGRIHGLIGPNGAGKTTLLDVLSGFVRPTRGFIALKSIEANSWTPERLLRQGLARTFQDIRLFQSLSVLENVELGALGGGLRRAEARRWASDVLHRMHLDHLAMLTAKSIPHGDARRVGIARAVATRPQFLLLDEPAAGLNEQESAELVVTIRGIRDDLSCGVLLVEHDMDVIMRLCDRIQVLDHGKTISVGRPDEVRADKAVIEAYFGTKGMGHGAGT